ncbi:MAG: hypothetical protein LLF76_14205 [Planctomycetaceae bacterium]|nr:hypothetical protein [Planctomycetaceae bacterium]
MTMPELFSSLNKAIEGAWPIALAGSFAWGILSVVLSPCHLASIPLIVGYVGEQGQISGKRTLWISVLFAAGILVTIGLIGAVTAGLGRIMGDVGRYGNYFVAVIFFAVGLYMLDVIALPWSGPGQVSIKRKGAIGALALGLIFGIALGPCTFAFMAPMLGLIFKNAAANSGYNVLLLLAYGIGHCSIIVLAGTFTGAVQRYLDWNERSKGALWLKKLCGVLVLLGGLWMIYTAS